MIQGVSANSFGLASNSLLARAFGPQAVRPVVRIGQRSAAERPDATPSADPTRPTERPYLGSAFQRNADGDTVTLSSKELDAEEHKELAKLQARDAQVRRHEQAHVAAGSGLTSGPHYAYTTGPDGRQYATSGRVRIDTASIPGDPDATIAKAQRIRAAALAPQDPSAADRSVAARASHMEAQARRELEGAGERSQRSAVETTHTDAIGHRPIGDMGEV
ncbi:MAG: hypothetical protein KAS72_05485 [Phycisphaerales bacterium]|nr:hypothetical protein [Phycisphaerales bacterium]